MARLAAEEVDHDDAGEGDHGAVTVGVGEVAAAGLQAEDGQKHQEVGAVVVAVGAVHL